MSWFSRAREFVEGTGASADDIEVEFDTIAESLNTLILAGQVVSTEDAAVTTKNEIKVVPGTEATISAPRASLVRVHADFDLLLKVASTEDPQLQGFLYVDGVKQTRVAQLELVARPKEGQETIRATVGQTWLLSLAAGNHTLVLKITTVHESVTWEAKAKSPGTAYDYLIMPEP